MPEGRAEVLVRSFGAYIAQRVLNSRTRKVVNRAATTLRLAAAKASKESGLTTRRPLCTLFPGCVPGLEPQSRDSGTTGAKETWESTKAQKIPVRPACE